MRKLILTQFWYCKKEEVSKEPQDRKILSDYRLVVVSHNPEATELDLTAAANQYLREWFPKEHPKFHLTESAAYPTIGADSEAVLEEKIPFYSEAMMLEFGQYILDRNAPGKPYKADTELHDWKANREEPLAKG